MRIFNMKKIFFLSAIVMGMAATSCDDYLDINVDPNSPSESVVTPGIVMPAAEMNFAATYGNLLRIPCGYHSQHFAQQFGTSNYVSYSQFEQSATRSSSIYTQNFRAIANFQTVIDKSMASEEYASVLAATCLRAMAFESMVDVYGAIPYSEALDPANTAPAYEDGLTVYQGLIKELDEAITLCKGANNKVVCTNFLFPNGSYQNWISFAQALKLRMLTRISGIADTQAQIRQIIDSEELPQEDIAYVSCWGNSSGNMNPYFSEEFSSNFGSTQINVIANMALIATMQQYDAEGNLEFQDGRLAKFFEPNGEGKYFGGLSGTNNSTASGFSTAKFCRPVASAQMPLSLISLCEIEFFKAEYWAKQKDAQKAAEAYENAIRLSFSSCGADGADEVIARYPMDINNWQKVIGIAKWVALAGIDDVEAYAEMRRLRYPAMGSVTGADIWDGASAYTMDKIVPGELYTPYQPYASVGTGKILERWPFAESSSSRNSNCPKFANEDFTKKIFFAN